MGEGISQKSEINGDIFNQIFDRRISKMRTSILKFCERGGVSSRTIFGSLCVWIYASDFRKNWAQFGWYVCRFGCNPFQRSERAKEKLRSMSLLSDSAFERVHSAGVPEIFGQKKLPPHRDARWRMSG